MFPAGTRLDETARIPVLEALRTVNAALLDLLRGFTAEDWSKPTVHRDRNVKDLTAHLLHGSLRSVTNGRDGYRTTTPLIRGTEDLIAFIQQENREFMTGMRRISPQILVELIAMYDPQMLALFENAVPDDLGTGVVWAGESLSRRWFHIAREYTEKWHHQQQLRDATVRPPLYEPALMVPVLETFARGLPFAYRTYDRPEGTALAIATTGPVSLGWTLHRTGGAWLLWSGTDSAAETSISIPSEIAWRVWTKSMGSNEARAHTEFVGDRDAVNPLVTFVAIMA
ncbi:MAG: maleylpyruvate isomerase N-terminal domain-containing protein [Acidobacteriia bacterium]|nr:maleylpyruvate isomerase N-terminal domain-containing protein [Terriglobia bacterium]